jgi:radical SAM protein with 4Fe4S-binding SPASM domain
MAHGSGEVAEAKASPRLIFWEVTKGCNLRCIHCRASATELSSPSDLTTATALSIIDQIAAAGNPILVLSGGEPLYRSDIFQLARYGTNRGLRVALATNGTLVTREVARMIVDSGVRRVSISLDGADSLTHDTFRGIPGAFEAAVQGLRNLKTLGMSVQINMTIARHNARQLPQVLELAMRLGADAPHYFRVARQRRAAERRGVNGERKQIAPSGERPIPGTIGPTDMAMPGSTGVVIHHSAAPHSGHPGGAHSGHPGDMNAMTKGCLAGTGVCFISHEGEIYPCGYLPVLAGDLRRQTFTEIWEKSVVFEQLRDTGNLKGKCGCCEFRNICMGCRARAFAATGDFLDEEPFCIYQPRTAEKNHETKTARSAAP